MAQAFTTQDGITLIDPGTYVSITVQAGQGNAAQAGVVTLIGEADEGLGFLEESDLSQVFFSPDQYGRVVAKYGSGRLVDAFAKIVSAANDPNILGAVTLVRMVKTNMSDKASAALKADINGLPTFADALAKKAGAPGNLIQYKSDIARAEVVPTTGAFTFAPALTGTTAVALRINGGDKLNATVTAKQAPTSLVSALEDVAKGILANGGREKLVLGTAGNTLSAAAVDANTLLVTLQSGQLWAVAPAVGDTAVIPASGDYGAAQDSDIAGVANANVGTYVVQAVTNTVTSATLTLKRVSSVGALIAASGTVSADFKDLILYSQITLRNISGDHRESMQDVFGTYSVLLNNGSQIQIETPASTEWNVNPKIGDIMKVASAFGTVQAGFYQITASTDTTLNATRISEGTSGSGTATPAYSSGTEPLVVLAPTKTGTGKTMSIEGDVSAIWLKSDATDAGLSNKRLISAAEYRNQITIQKGDSSNAYQGGGDIVLEVGCSQDDAHVEILADRIEFYLDADLQFTCTFKQFKTMSDLAAFINSQTNWSASVAASRFNAQAPSQLDKGSFDASGLSAHKNARMKRDAFDWSAAVNVDGLVGWTAARSGLPEATDSFQFLSGGAKNGTTSASVVTAIDAVERLSTNFIVPLFSVDASEDILDEETESSSTYTIDAINAYAKSHVNKMSQIEMRANRMAIGSKQAAYADVKQAAGEIAAFRFGLCFQPVKGQTSTGENKLFQPWMEAIVAAGMSSAAGYKGIVKKFANISGLGTVDGWDPSSPGDRKDALKAGLLFMERVPTGGFRWVSDQTTYSVDNNFVFNSIQAVYISDLITLTLIDRFDRLVVGKSVAEISAAAALSIFEAEMFNFKRLRWIASSEDAVKGYKNATADQIGGVMQISAELKLAGLIYFVPIALALSQVQQTATQQ
jgi:hypothetical protein